MLSAGVADRLPLGDFALPTCMGKARLCEATAASEQLHCRSSSRGLAPLPRSQALKLLSEPGDTASQIPPLSRQQQHRPLARRNHWAFLAGAGPRAQSASSLFSSSGGERSHETQDAEEEALEAQAVASLSEAELRKIVEKSNEAAAEALSAAQVAVWTEAIAAVGTFAAVLTSWIGWKMDDSELPPELQVPPPCNVGSGPDLPAELLRPPPGLAAGPPMAAPLENNRRQGARNTQSSH